METNYNPDAPFNLDFFLQIIDQVLNDLNEFKLHNNFLNLCRETTKIFSQMGGILDKAFQDIRAKANLIEHNYKLHKEIHQGLIQFIIYEKEHKIDILNGENGDYLIGTDMEKYKDYESTARTLLRLMWFLDFVFHMLDEMIKSKDKWLSNVCQYAYNQALYPNHPYHIIAAFKAGIYLIPGRDRLLEIVFVTRPQSYETLGTIRDKFNTIRQRLWQFYNEQSLTKLP